VDADRLRAVFPSTPDPLATLTTLEAVLGERPTFEAVAAALARAFEEEHGLRLTPGELTPHEQAQAERLVRERYGTASWLAGVA
jgi:lipoate-protein ligase A